MGTWGRHFCLPGAGADRNVCPTTIPWAVSRELEASTMSSDESFSESRRSADAHPEPPLWARSAEDEPGVLVVRQPVAPPSKPHPGFWWGVMWTIGMLIVSQIVPGIAIAIIALIVLTAERGGFSAAMK